MAATTHTWKQGKQQLALQQLLGNRPSATSFLPLVSLESHRNLGKKCDLMVPLARL